MLDALRERARRADLIDAIDRGRALRPTLRRQLGGKRWVVAHVSRVAPCAAAWQLEEHGAGPLTPPTPVFAQAFTAACVLHDLPPMQLRAALPELIDLAPLRSRPTVTGDTNGLADLAALPNLLRRWWWRERESVENDSPHSLGARMRTVLYAAWLASGMPGIDRCRRHPCCRYGSTRDAGNVAANCAQTPGCDTIRRIDGLPWRHPTA